MTGGTISVQVALTNAGADAPARPEVRLLSDLIGPMADAPAVIGAVRDECDEQRCGKQSSSRVSHLEAPN